MSNNIIPNFADSNKQVKLKNLFRLADFALTSQYIDATMASKLIGVALKTYKESNSRIWSEDPFLKRVVDEEQRFKLLLAALFDLTTNIEYCHNRVVNSRWIYCHRDDQGNPRAYYSFLKQCPVCCLDKGLEKRLAGAQHKPTSHHIGEITTTVTVLLLRLITSVAALPLNIASISKQSHDVDAIAFNQDTLVLFEVKSSPLATFPLVAELDEPLRTADVAGAISEYKQHSLIDLSLKDQHLSLFVPHRNILIPLGPRVIASWPYDGAIDYVSREEDLLNYYSAWLELYYAYATPKKRRTRKEQVLTYLVNGWGDEIDSNKTKPGLGRTDDIKKGTYQLLKFGAYYRDTNAKLQVRSALVANLDPLFLRGEYIDDLQDIRWAKGNDVRETEGGYFVPHLKLHYLYEGIITFNNPLTNDITLKEIFDFDRVDKALMKGDLDLLLEEWIR